MKEERKVSFAQAVTGLDNLVLFCQQQDLSVDIQLYSQLKHCVKELLEKVLRQKNRHVQRILLILKFNRETGWNVQK